MIVPTLFGKDLYLASGCLCTLPTRHTRVLVIPQIDHYCLVPGIHMRHPSCLKLLNPYTPPSSRSRFPGGLSLNVTASRKTSFILQDQIRPGSHRSHVNYNQQVSHCVLVRALHTVCNGKATQIRGKGGNLSFQATEMARVELASNYVVSLHSLLILFLYFSIYRLYCTLCGPHPLCSRKQGGG